MEPRLSLERRYFLSDETAALRSNCTQRKPVFKWIFSGFYGILAKSTLYLIDRQGFKGTVEEKLKGV